MLNGDLVIVDDVSENLSVLSSLLIKEGYRVRSAISGALALQTIELQIPDLILLDIRMPNMSGFEVCERLKANEKTRNIPVIFLSALNEVEDKVKAFSMGGVDYITKPFQADEVHARIQTHLMLAQQRSDIENLHLIQSQMIDLVTHNLKTPLSTILLYADMIKRASPEKVVNYANKINQTVEQMDSLVSDFFDLNRLDSTTTFAIQEINMAEFIKNVVEQYVFLAQKEDIELQIQLPDMPLIFHSDPRYLTEAISNLVANGIKYTPVGGTVLITAVQKDEKIIIELKDTGAGINEQHLPRIFDRFYRLPEHRESGIPGTGLGLSITQSIIHQLGGEITVESQLGEGTSFQILLPQK